MTGALPSEALALRILLGLVANLALAALAYRKGSVSRSGAFTGLGLGMVIYLGGGFRAWAVLLVFFVSSSALSRVGGAGKARLEALHEKGATRDGAQAFANAGVAALAMAGYAAFGEPWALFAFAGAMATATADTWSSELGVLSRRPPVSILSFRPVEPGSSGGVSLLGTAASLAGAAVIYAATVPLFLAEGVAAWAPGPVAASLLGGMAGSLIDSVLGARLQALYRDESGRLTEQPRGALVRGLRWMNNDAVNLLSNAAGALIGVACAAAGPLVGAAFPL